MWIFLSNMIRFSCSVSYALTCDTTTTVACSGLVGYEIMKCIRNNIEGEYKFALLEKPRPLWRQWRVPSHLKRDQRAAGFETREQAISRAPPPMQAISSFAEIRGQDKKVTVWSNAL